MLKSIPVGVLLVATFVFSADVQRAAGAPRPNPIPEAQRVDLNKASLAELLRVPGLTRVWAERIVRFRPYRTKQDLIDRGILPDRVYDRARDYVIVHREKR